MPLGTPQQITASVSQVLLLWDINVFVKEEFHTNISVIAAPIDLIQHTDSEYASVILDTLCMALNAYQTKTMEPTVLLIALWELSSTPNKESVYLALMDALLAQILTLVKFVTQILLTIPPLNSVLKTVEMVVNMSENAMITIPFLEMVVIILVRLNQDSNVLEVLPTLLILVPSTVLYQSLLFKLVKLDMLPSWSLM